MIACENVTKSFSDQVILNSFSFTFEDRGFYLLFGESGSGKTTFLNILSGFLDFEGGEIKWDSRTFTGRVRRSEIENECDYITQDSFFADFLSVSDNLRLICDSDEKIAAMLDRFGLSDKAEQMPTTLSGGERQRLAIARALLNGKRVLFLDEPTASLDEENKTTIFELLAKLSQSMLIICSSHDMLAKEYADTVIPFTKVHKKDIVHSESSSLKTKTEQKAGKQKTSGRKANLNTFLRKYFRSGQKSKKAAILFTVFLVLSSCLCLLADTPAHKTDSCIKNLYKINFLTVTTKNKTRWDEIAAGSDDIRSVVLNYSGSCPDGADDLGEDVIMRPAPDYEMSLSVLPFDKDVFKLSDNVRCGSYFTDRDQIILSSDMAAALYPSAPEKLIGEHISKNVYGLGDVNFEIVGIFDPFDDFEKQYLKAMGVDIEIGNEYSYNDLFFVNSKITDALEDDKAFFMGDKRTYQLYFDSFRDMKAYYDKYADRLDVRTVSYDSVDVSMKFTFEAMAITLLPLAGFMVFFSTLFYIALKKTEFVYNNRFVAVFEYSGYDKKKVISRFILLNLLELVRLMLIAEAAAFLLTSAVNLLSGRMIWVYFQLFTYNIWLIFLFNAFILLVSALAFNIMFRRVKVSSWYDNLIAARDLI